VALIKPLVFSSSKHPLTVRVSNPNGKLKINFRDSEDITKSALKFDGFKETRKISKTIVLFVSCNLIVIGLNILIGLRTLTNLIKYLLLLLKILV
jgi:hypothetical protein